MGLTILDIRDPELLHVVIDQSDSDGWASTEEIAKALAANIEDGHNPRIHVGVRLGYMRTKLGVVETRREKGMTLWRVTDSGVAWLNARLGTGQRRLLDGLSLPQTAAVIHQLTRQYRLASPAQATMIRREWRHGTRTY